MVHGGVVVPPVRDGRCTKPLTEETVHGEHMARLYQSLIIKGFSQSARKPSIINL